MRVVSALLFACIPMVGALGYAQPQWEREKGNCEMVMGSAGQADMAELNLCLRLWEAYRDVSRLSASERQVAAGAFSRIVLESDEQSRHIAEGAMRRMGVQPPIVKEAASQEPQRPKYQPRTASSADQKAAVKLRGQAMKMYKKKNYSRALQLLERALRLDGAYVQALYDSACCHALNRNKDEAIEYLRRLADIGTSLALEKVRLSRRDSDFSAYRDDPELKMVNGYATVKVLNGMPQDYVELGEENVYKLVGVLKDPKLGYQTVDGGEDKHTRDRPHIWFKEHSKNQALVIQNLINHPRTRLVPMDWDGSSDLIVSWADKVEISRDGEKIAKYSMTRKGGVSANPEKRLDDALMEQDKILREPEEYARKVEHVATTPDRIESKIDAGKSRVDRTVKTIDKAVDKAGRFFK